MGFLFTLLYIVTAYLGPQTVFGSLFEYHLEIIIVVVALIFTVFSAQGSGVTRWIETWAILGVCFVVAWSIMLNGWLGGGPKTLMLFLPDVMSFFLVALNCKKKWQLQVLAGVLFFVAAFDVTQAQLAVASGNVLSNYLMLQQTGATKADSIIRIRGLTFLNDPNDFAQFLVALIPCIFFFWGRRQALRNVLLVYVPAGFLVYGMYLTHSRGGMLALMALAIVAGRRKIGVVPAVVGGLVVFAGLSASGFSGGRDVAAGDDRIGAWSVGLQLIRSHPFFGVGFQHFVDYNEITAHNTFVVCAAELGLVGVFFWVLLMVVTLRNALEGSKDTKEGVTREEQTNPFLRGVPALPAVRFAGAGLPGTPPVAAEGHVFRSGAAFVLPGAGREDEISASGGESDEEARGRRRRGPALVRVDADVFRGLPHRRLVLVAGVYDVPLRECRDGRRDLQDGPSAWRRTTADGAETSYEDHGVDFAWCC